MWFRDWEITSDQYQWILKKHYETWSNKKQENVPREKVTYHGSLESCLRKITDEEMKQCETLEQVLSKIDEIREEFNKSLKGQ